MSVTHVNGLSLPPVNLGTNLDICLACIIFDICSVSIKWPQLDSNWEELKPTSEHCMLSCAQRRDSIKLLATLVCAVHELRCLRLGVDVTQAQVAGAGNVSAGALALVSP